jgi:DNA-3-methyladenine glycosylase II
VDPWQSLVSSIIGQQVSGAAASSIKRKFVALFHPPEGEGGTETDGDVKAEGYWDKETAEERRKPQSSFPTPAQVVATPLPTLRTAGLSQRKAEYISGLAAAFLDQSLTPNLLLNGTDEEVHNALIAIRGLGAWSVEMFMLFSLKRTDVFSTGDLGVQRGMAGFVGKWKPGKGKAAKGKEGGGKWKYMSEKEMLEIGERFRPFRVCSSIDSSDCSRCQSTHSATTSAVACRSLPSLSIVFTLSGTLFSERLTSN